MKEDAIEKFEEILVSKIKKLLLRRTGASSENSVTLLDAMATREHSGAKRL